MDNHYNHVFYLLYTYAFSSSSRAKGPFEIVEKDIPEPGSRQVRIKVQACAYAMVIPLPKKGYSLAFNTQGFQVMKLQVL